MPRAFRTIQTYPFLLGVGRWSLGYE